MVSCAAIVVASTVVHREFFTGRPAPPRTRAYVTYTKEWRTLLTSGRLIGDSAAPVKIIEFMDIECPFCRQLNAALHTVRQKYPNEVAYVFVHYPLPTHRFGAIAARAAECGASAGRFLATIDALYAKQDSFGLRPWSAYAKSAGLSDTGAFAQCVSQSSSPPLVSAGVAAGRKIGVSGTPTVIVNGWRYSATPSDAELLGLISDVLAGRTPQQALAPGAQHE